MSVMIKLVPKRSENDTNNSCYMPTWLPRIAEFNPWRRRNLRISRLLARLDEIADQMTRDAICTHVRYRYRRKCVEFCTPAGEVLLRIHLQADGTYEGINVRVVSSILMPKTRAELRGLFCDLPQARQIFIMEAHQLL